LEGQVQAARQELADTQAKLADTRRQQLQMLLTASEALPAVPVARSNTPPRLQCGQDVRGVWTCTSTESLEARQ
jgi:hypothetical protein